MVSSNEVKVSMLNCFPKCPICYQSKGYDVLGADKDYVSCKKCFATWQSDDFSKGAKLSKLKLTQPSKEGTGSSLLKRTYSIDFWQNHKETLTRKTITLYVDEEIKEFVFSRYQDFLSEDFEGCLFLTTNRVIFVIYRDFVSNFKVGIRYEEIATFESNVESKKGTFCLKINDQLGVTNRFNVNSEKELNFILEKIQELKNKNSVRIEQEKIGKGVQVVLDFSSLKDVMSKGGIVMTAYKCPICNGKLDIPEAGKVLVCGYCGTPIKPIDIFEKIKSLIQ